MRKNGQIDDRYRYLIYSFILAIIISFVISWVSSGGFTAINTWMNTGPEQILNIPVNIHHDLIGLIFIGAGTVLHKKLKGDKEFLLIGFGIGLIVHHVFTEGGLILISSL